MQPLSRMSLIILVFALCLLAGAGILAAQDQPAVELPEATPEAAPEATPEPAPEAAALVSDQTYTVVRGDRLIKIAEQYGVTASCLAAANRLPNPNLIYPGQRLVIPASCQGGGGDPDAADAAALAAERRACQFDRYPGRSAPGGVYVVRAGDTLDFIACDFGVSLACLRETNPQLGGRSLIRAGDRIIISAACPSWDGPPGPGDIGG